MASKPNADAMRPAADLAVSAVLDQRSNPRGEGNSRRDYMISCGVDVKGDARYPIMHDKFIVVDGAHVETGSFNYTSAAAERNTNNALVNWNNAEIANRYALGCEPLFAKADD